MVNAEKTIFLMGGSVAGGQARIRYLIRLVTYDCANKRLLDNGAFAPWRRKTGSSFTIFHGGGDLPGGIESTLIAKRKKPRRNGVTSAACRVRMARARLS
jgi:hypothetical protein